MMCLPDFVVNYDTSYSTDTNKGTHDDVNPDNEHDEDTNEDQNSKTQTIKLKRGLGKMQKKKTHQYFIQDDTSYTMNQRNATIQNFSFTTRRQMKMI